MPKGKVKWYNEAKGYGFIGREEGGDLFVHRTGLMNAHNGLTPEQEVFFEIEEGEKGLKAVHVE